MDFLSLITNYVSEKALENLSSFLGESKSSVESGLILSLNSFMAGLSKHSNSDVETTKIIKILNDGGHTGDILNNFEGFSENYEKTQLLVTIGNNIVNHFIGTKSNSLIEKIADISEIKKTSASSLLSLSGPFILGFIGKSIKENNLNTSELTAYFKEINSSVPQTLPPAISNIFQIKKNNDSPASENKIVGQISKPLETKDSSNWGNILPWVLLAVVGIGTIYYSKVYKNKNNTNQNTLEVPFIKQDSLELLPEDFLPDLSDSLNAKEKNIVVVPKEEKPGVIEEESKPAVKNIEKLPAATDTKPKLIEPKKVEENSDVKKGAAKKLEESPKDKPKESNNFSIPSGWKSVNGQAFRKNSAELTNENVLNSILAQLKNSNKKIEISPLSGQNKALAEDRAYALREKLIEKGVDEDKIKVLEAQKGNDPNGVVFKIKN